MKQFVFVFLLILLSARVRANGRIYSGEPAKEGEFPFLVSLTKNGEHFCGGFIYNQRIIVTAASCVDNMKPFDVTVVVGQYSYIVTDPFEKRYQVAAITQHETYDPIYRKNNIAVIQTLQSITLTKDHVEIGYFNAVNETDPESTIMGWGINEEGGLASINLLKASVQILPKTDCQIYGADAYNPIYMVCAGSDSASPCLYDEGSPLFQQGYVVGIVSSTQDCLSLFLPTLFTRLASYTNWLKINAGQQPPPLIEPLL